MMDWLLNTWVGNVVFIILGLAPFAGMFYVMVSCFGRATCSW